MTVIASIKRNKIKIKEIKEIKFKKNVKKIAAFFLGFCWKIETQAKK